MTTTIDLEKATKMQRKTKMKTGTRSKKVMAQPLTELQRLSDALSEVIKKEALGRWLQTPKPAFDGSKPLERGESDRVWQMVYFLRSVVPF